jgi:Fur family peroxide stress response transcriptional regulator
MIANLVKQLRSRGIAVTPQRLAVLGALQNRKDHPTAEKIYQEVRRQLPAISFNTVYKTLEVLCQKAMVIKVNPLHEVARYDGDTGAHAHLICRSCHHIIDLEIPAGDLGKSLPEDLHGFQVEYPSLTVWGLCPECQQCESDKEE